MSYFLCPMPKNSNVIIVSLVLDDPCTNPLHTLPVIHLKTLHEENVLTKKFTVCVAPLHGRMERKYRLVEWIEMNRILGVEFFVFYNYFITNDDLKILSYYTKQGLAEVLPWTLLMKHNIHYYAQLAAINDCIFRHRSTTELVAIFDLDEFIIPRGSKDITWTDMFRRIPDASSYIFRTIFFPIKWKVDGNNLIYLTDMKNVTQYRLVTQEKIWKVDTIFPSKIRSKTIVNPRLVDAAGIHYVWSHSKGSAITVDTNVGLVHHYTNWRWELNETEPVIDTTAMKYQNDLIVRVNVALTEILREQ